MLELAIPFPNISPFLFELPVFEVFGHAIGPLGVRYYALGYIVGIIIAWWILAKLANEPKVWGMEKVPFTAENIDDFIFYATLGILLGGRLGYALFYAPQMFSDPPSLLRTWEGGMSFHGGIIGVCLAVLYVASRNKIPLLKLADAVAFASPLGIGLVRIANFINQELWGRPTNVPWAFIFDTDPQHLPRHPSQLYEATFEGFLLFAILYIAVCKFKTLHKSGLTAGIFITLYAIARIGLENLREPDASLFFGVLTRGMTYSIPMLILGVTFIFIGLKSKKAVPIA